MLITRKNALLLPRKQAKGVALIITIMLSLVAASIAMVLVGQAVQSSTLSAYQTDLNCAKLDAGNTRQAFEKALADDPYFYLNNVWQTSVTTSCGGTSTYTLPIAENPRMCLTSAPGYTSPISAPGAWPVACGSVWKYQAAPSTAGPLSIVQIYPPSAYSQKLTLAVTSIHGGTNYTTVYVYSQHDANSFAIYSPDDLSLAGDSGGNGSGSAHCNTDANHITSVIVQGVAYSRGNLSLNCGSSVKKNSAVQYLSEKSIIANSTSDFDGSGSASYYATNSADASSQTGNQPIGNIRTILSAPLAVSNLAPAVMQMRSLSCNTYSGGTVQNPAAMILSPSPQTATNASLNSGICLQKNATVYDTTGTSHTIPNASAYLIVSGSDSSSGKLNNTLKIYYRDPANDPSGYTPGYMQPGAECTNAANSSPAPQASCSVTDELAQSSSVISSCESSKTAAGCSFPGDKYYWTQLAGTYNYPSTGIIATDQDVHLGLCGVSSASTSSGFTTSAGVCDKDYAAPIGGPITIEAGSIAQPKDIYVTSPVCAISIVCTNAANPLKSGYNAGTIGAVASGRVYFPYWATTRGGSVKGDISAVALGETNSCTLSGASCVNFDTPSISGVSTLPDAYPSMSTDPLGPSNGSGANNWNNTISINSVAVATTFNIGDFSGFKNISIGTTYNNGNNTPATGISSLQLSTWAASPPWLPGAFSDWSLDASGNASGCWGNYLALTAKQGSDSVVGAVGC